MLQRGHAFIPAYSSSAPGAAAPSTRARFLPCACVAVASPPPPLAPPPPPSRLPAPLKAVCVGDCAGAVVRVPAERAEVDPAATSAALGSRPPRFFACGADYYYAEYVPTSQWPSECQSEQKWTFYMF